MTDHNAALRAVVQRVADEAEPEWAFNQRIVNSFLKSPEGAERFLADDTFTINRGLSGAALEVNVPDDLWDEMKERYA